MSGTLSKGGNRIISIEDPSSVQDVATKNYADVLGVPNFVVTTGTLPTLTLVGLVIYTLPTNKTVAKNKT